MSGLDIPIFKEFQKNWPNIVKSNYSTFETDQVVYDKLKDVAMEVLLFVEKRIREELPKNDYKEFLELIIIFLGGTPPNEKKRKIVDILKEKNNEDTEPQKKLLLKPDKITDFLNRTLPTDLFTPHTFSTFSRFNISTDFLQLDPLG
ncbi:hypothetical protein QTP88_014310 [Uroleucon formosanum]